MKEYLKILSNEIPDFLNDYINTPQMQKLSGISVSCGTYYTKLFDKMVWYSSLEHSIAVSLIVWNFTKDKKQTIAGLFHDIATPVFKHSIDFMNGDYKKQESTEDLTTQIISESKEIMSLLKRDGIKIEEVDNYHIYPIADNDTPMLSADRLEYTLSNGLGACKNIWNLEEVKEIYENIEIQKNEQGIEELGFKDIKIAEKFVDITSKLSIIYIEDRTRYSMQLIADILKDLSNYSYSHLYVVANLPYYITTPILFKLLEDENSISSITVMVQKEVADRMVASPKSKEYGILTLMVDYFSNADTKLIVPNSSFIPEPGVTSAVINLQKDRKYEVKDEKVFFELIHKAFAQRRKKMVNSLTSTNFNNMDKQSIEKLFLDCDIKLTARAEELEIEDFIKLANNIE